MKASRIKAPSPVVRRLAIYHHLLMELREQGVQVVSSTRIAEALEYKPIQVRKDLQLTGLVGKPRTGFQVGELEEAISRFMGWSEGYQAILFGVGNLGSALLNYPWTEEYGLRFAAAFDVSPSRSNILINNIPVFHTSHFPVYAADHTTAIAVLAVPASQAQAVADMAVQHGITGIWNFTYAHIKAQPRSTVENALFTQSLAILTRRIIEARANPPEPRE